MARERFDDVVQQLRACRVCIDRPLNAKPLPQAPNPIVQGSETARLCIAGQAPGIRAHTVSKTFCDPSGVRLRQWLGLDEDTFYDPSRITIVPMGACFPGHDDKGGDLPPRRECAIEWRERLLAPLINVELILAIGQYSQRWHLREQMSGGLTETVKNWRSLLEGEKKPKILPLPHPSWRNNRWLKDNPWFEEELLPVLREEVQRLTRKGA